MPRLVDVESKRSDLVVASLQVIAREGLEAASLRRIAAQAGCTTGQLTHYFPGREALLIETLRAAHFAAAARMLQAVKGAVTPAARLEGVVWESLPLDAVRLREWKVWLAFWSAAARDVALAAENARRYDEWRDLLETLTAPFHNDALEIRRAASALMALIDGYGVRLTLLDGAALAAQAARAELGAHLDQLTGGRR